MDVCKDLIVEHECKSFFDRGLRRLPVIKGSRPLVDIPDVSTVPPGDGSTKVTIPRVERRV